MKTIKFIALAIFSLAVLNSCTESDSRDPYYDDGNQEQWYTEILEVKYEDWKLVGRYNEIGSHYEYSFNGFPYVGGIINVYMYIDFDKSTEKQIPLPYTQYEVEIIDGVRVPYSVQYSYIIEKNGTITFKIYVNDYYTESLEDLLLTEYFRVAIIY
jgi:hypothetical protein